MDLKVSYSLLLVTRMRQLFLMYCMSLSTVVTGGQEPGVGLHYIDNFRHQNTSIALRTPWGLPFSVFPGVSLPISPSSSGPLVSGSRPALGEMKLLLLCCNSCRMCCDGIIGRSATRCPALAAGCRVE